MSYEGEQLINAVRPYEYKSRLLLGTGDNLALYLPSRIFAPSPDTKTGQYAKDQFRWDPNPGEPRWVNPDPQALLADLRKGLAIVPTDNVGCFLGYAGYDAIVPGKEDFYFGPERLQALARFLASIPESDRYHPVQMLAANLLVKTSWVSDHDPIPDSKKPRLGFDISDSSQRPKSYISFPADGTEILPWLAKIEGNLDNPGAVQVIVSGPVNDPDQPDWKTFQLINSSASVDFVQDFQCWAVPAVPGFQVDSRCHPLVPVSDPTGSGKTFWQLPLRPLAHGNYKACIWTSAAKDARPICSRFKVGVPLFQYAGANLTSAVSANAPQTDPSPYLIKRICKNLASSECVPDDSSYIAVFGVVDPDLEQKIGSLEAVWRTVDRNGKYAKNYETSLEVLDPSKSLDQLIDYLHNCGIRGKEKDGDICYGAASDRPGNNGTFRKILLAQMDGTAATLLASHLTLESHFDVIISQYDEQQFTRNQISVVDPTLYLASSSEADNLLDRQKSNKLLDCDKVQCNLPSFIAVPPPAWDPTWSGDAIARDSARIGDAVRVLRISDDPVRHQRQYVVSGARAKPNGAAICEECVPEAEREKLANSRRRIADQFKLSATAEKTLRDWTAAILPQPSPPTDTTEMILEHATLYAMLQTTHADVALVQKHDFYLPIPLADCLLNQLSPDSRFPNYCSEETRKPPFSGVYAWQKVIDALIWKGDILTVIPVRGSVLQAVLKRSRQFDANDVSSLSLIKESDRGLVTLGIKSDGFKDAYLINDLPLDPNRVYSVATTDYIALGDTGYPDLIDPSVPHLPRPLYDKKLQSISSLVCNQLEKAPGGDSIVCTPDFKGQGYFDELEVTGPAPPPGNTWQQGWKNWVRSLRSNGKQGSDLESWAQEKIPTWRFSLDKTNLGFTVQRHSDTQADLNNTFGGVSNSQATASRSHSWNTDQEMSYTYNHPLWDFVSTEALLYNASFTDTKSGTYRNSNQSTDSLALSAGPRFHLPGMRKLPHWAIGTYFHYDTQAFSLEQSLSLTKNQIDVATPLLFFLPRINTLTDRIAIGRYNQKSYFEAGVEAGRALGSFEQFNIFTNGVLVLQCIPSATLSLQKCVGKFGDTIVTPTSTVQTLQNSRGRMGAYWHSMLNFPTGKRMSASLENQGEFYFNSAGDNSTDTRLQHLVTAKYSFQVWQSLSFSPTYQFFLYENKQAYKSLWQQQAMMTIDYKFDWTSKRIAASQLEYRAAPSK
jgi:hypothetical protein